MVEFKRVSPGRYEVKVDGTFLGHVWKESVEQERFTRWGSRNASHTTYIAHYWRCSGEKTEMFPTRDEAVWHMKQLRYLSTQSDVMSEAGGTRARALVASRDDPTDRNEQIEHNLNGTDLDPRGTPHA